MDLFSHGIRPWGMPCLHPTAKAPVTFPRHLLVDDPGTTEMFSGYVNVTKVDYLFYWFAQAEDTVPVDAPLIVWSNGGPGCSAMEGMTTEHGPFVLYGVKEDGDLFGGRLSKNPYSWNKQAHVLYVDQPRYVGYSCGLGPFITSSADAGQDMVTFLRGWRLLFPEHAHRNIIFATESYGGHYVPAWATAVFDYNLHTTWRLNLVGIAIGNGIIDDAVQSSSFPEFAERLGLLPEKTSWPTPRTNEGLRDLMKDYLGYTPNYYDYRLKEQECCGCSSYNYKAWADWLLREDVIQALNVCGNAGIKAFANCAAGCINLPEFDKDDSFDYSAALGRALGEGVHVTLYYGMQDTACDYVGGYKVASSLRWPGAGTFATAPLEDLVIGDQPVGKLKAAGGLTWVQVEGAGHMVPINNPAAAAFAIGTLISASNGGTASARTLCMPTPNLPRTPGSLHYLQRLYASRSGALHPEQLQDLVLAFMAGCLITGFVTAAVFRLGTRRAAARSEAALPRRALSAVSPHEETEDAPEDSGEAKNLAMGLLLAD